MKEGSWRVVGQWPLRIGRRFTHDGCAHLTVHGELDLGSVGQLDEAIDLALADGALELLIDLRGLQFMDSSGIHLLLTLAERARSDGVSLSITGAHGPVLRAIELSGVDAVLPLRGQPRFERR